MTPPNQRYIERPLPSSEESERVILGSIIVDNTLMEQAVNLDVVDFYSPFNRCVFRAMLAIYRKGSLIEPVGIGEELKRHGDMAGGVSQIANLPFGIPYMSDLSSFIDTVRKKARRRDLIHLCSNILEAALLEQGDEDALFVDAQTKINELCRKAASIIASDGFIPLKDIIASDVIPTLKDLHAGVSRKIPTGFSAIDAAIGGGLSTSDVMLLCGLPSSGKSALALQIAFNVARNGTPAAFLAGEMTNQENVFRLISQVSSFQNLNSCQHLNGEEYETMVKWAQEIEDVPLHLDHRTSDVQGLAARLRSIVKQKGIKLLVIDYIQLLTIEKSDRRKRFERITEASQEVKRLANELDIAVISVAQFNREGTKSVRPSMHDLEASSQLEKDASLILIIDRNETELTDVNVRVVKGRNSGVSSFRGKFYGRSVSFDFSKA